ncbi:hypothetical protein V7S43_015414 [Phytophthora oleae]|uniref:Uncharacterized protein n=1 Tax=Phytophthora oleae TaxID=2107226 RepID=A0ABD3F284_9STRA
MCRGTETASFGWRYTPTGAQALKKTKLPIAVSGADPEADLWKWSAVASVRFR